MAPPPPPPPTNEDACAATSIGSTISSSVKFMVTMLINGMTNIGLVDAKTISEQANITKDAGVFGSMLGDLVPTLMKLITDALTPAEMGATAQLENMATIVNAHLGTPLTDYVADRNLSEELFAIPEKVIKLLASLPKDIDAAHNCTSLSSVLVQTTSAINNKIVILKGLRAGQNRVDPVCVVFAGRPGVGKSTMIDNLHESLAVQMKWSNSNLYQMRLDGKHFSPYGHQSGFTYDEFAKGSFDKCPLTAVQNELFSGIPYAIPGAALETKNQHLTSKVGYLTTNHAFPVNGDRNPQQMTLMSFNAFRSRMVWFEIIDDVIGNHPDPRSVTWNHRQADWSHLSIRLWRMGAGGPGHINITYDQMRRYIIGQACMKEQSFLQNFMRSIPFRALPVDQQQVFIDRLEVVALSLPTRENGGFPADPLPPVLPDPVNNVAASTANGEFFVMRLQGKPGVGKTRCMSRIVNVLRAATSLPVVHVPRTFDAPLAPSIYILDDILLNENDDILYMEWVNRIGAGSIIIIITNNIIGKTLCFGRSVRSLIANYKMGAGLRTYCWDAPYPPNYSGIARRIGLPGLVWDGSNCIIVPEDSCATFTFQSCTNVTLNGEPFDASDKSMFNYIVEKYDKFIKKSYILEYCTDAPPAITNYDITIVCDDLAMMPELLSNPDNMVTATLSNFKGVTIRPSPEFKNLAAGNSSAVDFIIPFATPDVSIFIQALLSAVMKLKTDVKIKLTIAPGTVRQSIIVAVGNRVWGLPGGPPAPGRIQFLGPHLLYHYGPATTVMTTAEAYQEYLARSKLQVWDHAHFRVQYAILIQQEHPGVIGHHRAYRSDVTNLLRWSKIRGFISDNSGLIKLCFALIAILAIIGAMTHLFSGFISDTASKVTFTIKEYFNRFVGTPITAQTQVEAQQLLLNVSACARGAANGLAGSRRTQEYSDDYENFESRISMNGRRMADVEFRSEIASNAAGRNALHDYYNSRGYSTQESYNRVKMDAAGTEVFSCSVEVIKEPVANHADIDTTFMHSHSCTKCKSIFTHIHAKAYTHGTTCPSCQNVKKLACNGCTNPLTSYYAYIANKAYCTDCVLSQELVLNVDSASVLNLPSVNKNQTPMQATCNAIAKNLMQVHGRQRLYGIAIKGHLVIAPSHVISYEGELISATFDSGTGTITVPLKTLFVEHETQTAVFELPKTVQQFKDITHLIATSIQLRDVTRGTIFKISCAGVTGFSTSGLVRYEVVNHTDSTLDHYIHQAHALVLYNNEQDSELTLGRGDCGAPLIVVTNTGLVRFGGLFTSTSATTFTSTTLLPVLRFLSTRVESLSADGWEETRINDQVFMTPTAYGTILRSLTPSKFVSKHNNILGYSRELRDFGAPKNAHMPVLANFPKLNFPINCAPSALTLARVTDKSKLSVDIDGKPNILFTQVDLFGTTTPSFDHTTLDAVNQYLTRYFLTHIEETKPLSWERVLNGERNQKHADYGLLNAIEPSASAGLYFSKIRSKKSKGDIVTNTAFEGQVHNYVFANEHGLELKALLDQNEHFLKNGIPCLHLSKCCEKDELLPIEKIAIGKTRCFISCDFVLVLMQKRYLGDFTIQMARNRDHMHSQRGVNPYTEFTPLAKRLKSMGGTEIAIDYSRFDRNVQYHTRRALYDIISQSMKSMPDARKFFKALADQDANSMLTFHGNLYKRNTAAGLLSGEWGTTIVGDFANLQNLLYAVFSRYKELNGQYPVATQVRSLFDCITYSDDAKATFHPSLKMTFEDLVHYGNQIGYIVTRADKDALLDSEDTFLSRSMMLSKDGLVYPALKITSITRVLHFTTSMEPDQLFTNICGGLREAALHGEDMYNLFVEDAKAIVRKLPAFYKKNLVPRLVYPEYSMIRSEWKHYINFKDHFDWSNCFSVLDLDSTVYNHNFDIIRRDTRFQQSFFSTLASMNLPVMSVNSCGSFQSLYANEENPVSWIHEYFALYQPNDLPTESYTTKGPDNCLVWLCTIHGNFNRREYAHTTTWQHSKKDAKREAYALLKRDLKNRIQPAEPREVKLLSPKKVSYNPIHQLDTGDDPWPTPSIPVPSIRTREDVKASLPTKPYKFEPQKFETLELAFSDLSMDPCPSDFISACNLWFQQHPTEDTPTIGWDDHHRWTCTLTGEVFNRRYDLTSSMHMAKQDAKQDVYKQLYAILCSPPKVVRSASGANVNSPHMQQCIGVSGRKHTLTRQKHFDPCGSYVYRTIIHMGGREAVSKWFPNILESDNDAWHILADTLASRDFCDVFACSTTKSEINLMPAANIGVVPVPVSVEASPQVLMGKGTVMPYPIMTATNGLPNFSNLLGPSQNVFDAMGEYRHVKTVDLVGDQPPLTVLATLTLEDVAPPTKWLQSAHNYHSGTMKFSLTFESLPTGAGSFIVFLYTGELTGNLVTWDVIQRRNWQVIIVNKMGAQTIEVELPVTSISAQNILISSPNSAQIKIGIAVHTKLVPTFPEASTVVAMNVYQRMKMSLEGPMPYCVTDFKGLPATLVTRAAISTNMSDFYTGRTLSELLAQSDRDPLYLSMDGLGGIVGTEPTTGALHQRCNSTSFLYMNSSYLTTDNIYTDHCYDVGERRCYSRLFDFPVIANTPNFTVPALTDTELTAFKNYGMLPGIDNTRCVVGNDPYARVLFVASFLTGPISVATYNLAFLIRQDFLIPSGTCYVTATTEGLIYTLAYNLPLNESLYAQVRFTGVELPQYMRTYATVPAMKYVDIPASCVALVLTEATPMTPHRWALAATTRSHSNFINVLNQIFRFSGARTGEVIDFDMVDPSSSQVIASIRYDPATTMMYARNGINQYHFIYNTTIQNAVITNLRASLTTAALPYNNPFPAWVSRFGETTIYTSERSLPKIHLPFPDRDFVDLDELPEQVDVMACASLVAGLGAGLLSGVGGAISDHQNRKHELEMQDKELQTKQAMQNREHTQQNTNREDIQEHDSLNREDNQAHQTGMQASDQQHQRLTQESAQQYGRDLQDDQQAHQSAMNDKNFGQRLQMSAAGSMAHSVA